MACYGVDTAPVERMSEALERLDIDLLDLRPNQFLSQARRRRKEFGMLVELYLDMVSCFFAVMRAVAARDLVLEREAVAQGTRERQVVDRSYLEGFLPIYDRASERSVRHLRRLLKAAFVRDPELQAAFVSRTVESGTAAEVRQYTAAVKTGNSPAEAQEHGVSGKEITDSIKDLIKGWLNKYVEDDSRVRRRLKKLLHVDVTKEGIEQAFRVINEVLGMFFHGPA
jgi:hypothetical protein